MSEEIEYRLTNDIIDNHGERMSNLRKYYPFFCLQAASLGQFKEGKYAFLDMGYITMALLRFLIEENNFNEKDVTLKQVHSFLAVLLQRDFELHLPEEEEKELTEYLFDKIRNDGKPFSMEYFDPADKKRKTARMKLVDSGLSAGNVVYYITADAIEFYLDTKEIQEESRINIEQLLLEKMIQTKNFRGGIDVVRRMNSEVNRLRQRKKEVLLIMSYNVFEGVKALEEFNCTGIRWFKEEQKAFQRNRELTENARQKAEQAIDTRESGLQEIFLLDTELKKAMMNHGRLLADCMELQVRADEIIHKFKYSRLRNAFDFRSFAEKAKEQNDASLLSTLVLPLFKPHTGKFFAVGSVDELLNAPVKEDEVAEKVEEGEEVMYRFEDEIEEERIGSNYHAILKTLLDTLLVRERFDLKEFNKILEDKYFDEIFRNSDYYSFLVHLCQKREYDLTELRKKQDTFLEGILAKMLLESGDRKYRGLRFRVRLLSDMTKEPEEAMGSLQEEEELLHRFESRNKNCEFVTTNLEFIRG
ncbi:MAG: hypothetical protein IJY09_05395 [Lachnospiraceae bacterium]|nr:hypothetical protein [Lachnospiraceae bacterium]